MSREEWFRAFEQLYAEHPDATDDELSDLAHELMVDRLTARAEQLRDEAKYEQRRSDEPRTSGPDVGHNARTPASRADRMKDEAKYEHG